MFLEVKKTLNNLPLLALMTYLWINEIDNPVFDKPKVSVSPKWRPVLPLCYSQCPPYYIILWCTKGNFRRGNSIHFREKLRDLVGISFEIRYFWISFSVSFLGNWHNCSSHIRQYDNMVGSMTVWQCGMTVSFTFITILTISLQNKTHPGIKTVYINAI